MRVPASGTSARTRLAAVAAGAVALTMVVAGCGGGAPAPQGPNPWNQLAAAYPSLAGSDGLVVPSMKPDTSPAGTLYQTAYGRAALRFGGRKLPTVSSDRLLETLDQTARIEPIWSAFQLCMAVGDESGDLLDRAQQRMAVDVRARAVESIRTRDGEAGYSAQVLGCSGTQVLEPHRADVQGIVADADVTPYQRYLAARALGAAGIEVHVDSRTLPSLPDEVTCSDPTAASHWMAIHQLRRMADPEFYHPDRLVDCAVEVAGQLNAQSALAAVVVADRKPGHLQKLSTPVLDPLEQAIDADGMLIPPPPGGLRSTFSYAAALHDGGAEIPRALTAAVQDQINTADAPEDASRDALFAGLCAVDSRLRCPDRVLESGRRWVADADFADLDVNLYTWTEALKLARVLDITPRSQPSAADAAAFTAAYSSDLEQIPGLVDELITAASAAGMEALVDALRPLSDPQRSFREGLEGESLTAAAWAYTAATTLGIDTDGWLDDLAARLERFAINDQTRFPFSETPQPAPADSAASIAAATLISASTT
ncbi:Uncharacterised protein [Gordonia paraffinivorans]|uniref:Uncharacterized protein n=2 Tax=Gordonia paraffinivorans TaxID=175628 RepID=A0ABD7V643_9ACTN|nr:Uncharacterised protein [Gordonia paraffinivorans]